MQEDKNFTHVNASSIFLFFSQQYEQGDFFKIKEILINTASIIISQIK